MLGKCSEKKRNEGSRRGQRKEPNRCAVSWRLLSPDPTGALEPKLHNKPSLTWRQWNVNLRLQNACGGGHCNYPPPQIGSSWGLLNPCSKGVLGQARTPSTQGLIVFAYLTAVVGERSIEMNNPRRAVLVLTGGRRVMHDILSCSTTRSA